MNDTGSTDSRKSEVSLSRYGEIGFSGTSKPDSIANMIILRPYFDIPWHDEADNSTVPQTDLIGRESDSSLKVTVSDFERLLLDISSPPAPNEALARLLKGNE